MKLGSLFDGVGGFPLSATYHGIEPVWASEIEPFPIAVTKIRFPDMKHLGDITQINGAEIEPVDIITFGSPCQDLSVAGKRAGLEGKRSNLFYRAVEIIREMRDATNGRYPRFAVWENVPGAFSSNGGADFQSVLEELCQTEIPIPDSGRWADAGMVRGGKCEVAWRVLDAQYWGVPQRRKRIFLVCDFTGQCAGEILFERDCLPGDSAESRKAWEEVAACVGNGTQSTIAVTYGMDLSQKAEGIGFAEEKAACLTNGTHAGHGAHALIAGTVSAKWAKGTGGPAGDECQNLVAGGFEGDIARTLTARHDSSPCVDRGQDLVFSPAPARIGYTVRRLTPLECERLQGFPDGWTDIPGASDTGRYKALGNSVAVPCVAWIMGRIKTIVGVVEAVWLHDEQMRLHIAGRDKNDD